MSLNPFNKQALRRDLIFQFWGWVLFVICAVLFILSSLQNKDVLVLLGSIVFLLACILFLIPLIHQLRQRVAADDGRASKSDPSADH